MFLPKVQDHVLQPYKTTGTFAMIILILTLVKDRALNTNVSF